jgi:putative ABC transport system permease protein
MFRNYLLIAFRNFRRNKGYTFLNIFGLAIGIAVCILLFLWVKHETSFDRFNKNIDQIYSVIQKGIWNDGEEYGSYTIPYVLTPLMNELYPEIERHVRLRTLSDKMMQYDDKIFFEDILLSEPDLLNIFSFELIKGDIETALEDKYSLILTETIARKYFGDEDPLGKVVRYSNRLDFTVTGIVKDPPTNSSVNFDIIAPFKVLGEERINGWSWESSGYILLREGVDVEDFSKKIENVILENNSENKNTVLLQPLKMRHLYGALDEPDSLNFVLVFSAIGILVLLIACINFMNLATARSLKRSKEVGMRKVMGARKNELIHQFLSESVLTAFLAMIIAVVLAELCLPEFNKLAGRELNLNLSNLTFTGFIIAVTLLVGFVSGSYPAFYLSRFKPDKVLKGSKSAKTKTHFRTILVVLQFTISIALIISTMIILIQMDYIRNKDLGFRKDQVIGIPINGELSESFRSFKDELLKNSNITGVTNASSSPANIGNVNPATWEGKVEEERVLFNFYLVEHDFLDIFEMQLVAGENFSKDLEEGDEIPYIVNESAVELMGLEDPIGKRFRMYDESNAGRIIGVVKDFHFQRLINDIGPIMITTLNWWRRVVYVKVNSKDMTYTLAHIENTHKKFAPSYPYEFSFLDEEIDDLYTNFYEMESIIKYFAILAILISCLGLFGLASFTTEQRTKEIGVRKVMGSSVTNIVFLLTKGFTKWVLLANIVAWPVAYYGMKKFLDMFAYKTNISILIFIFSGLLALLIAIITVCYQAIKAANANPVEALKYE